MKKIITLAILIICTCSFGQKDEPKTDELLKKVQTMELENENLKKSYENLSIQYQHTNDRLNNYLSYTANVSAIFGILIALAGIYIGFESLKTQNKAKDAVKTLEEAKSYVTDKKTEFDGLIESKKQLLQNE